MFYLQQNIKEYFINQDSGVLNLKINVLQIIFF